MPSMHSIISCVCMLGGNSLCPVTSTHAFLGVFWCRFQPRTEGMAPSPRDQCSAVYHENIMYIFGGRSSAARSNELFALDLDQWCWMVPDTGGSAPSPRQGAALAVHGAGANPALRRFVIPLQCTHYCSLNSPLVSYVQLCATLLTLACSRSPSHPMPSTPDAWHVNVCRGEALGTRWQQQLCPG